MTKALHLILAVLIATHLGGSTLPAKSAKPSELAVTAELRIHEGLYELEFHVRNMSKHKIPIYSSDLPWDPQENNSLLIVAVKTDPPGQVLPSTREARGSDPGNIITLNPGKQLTGALNLNIVFPELTAELEMQDVYILWSHTIEIDDPQRFCEAFGGVRIPWKHYGKIVVDPPPPPPPNR